MRTVKWVSGILGCIALTSSIAIQPGYAMSTQATQNHQEDTKVGTGVADITPNEPVFLGGYNGTTIKSSVTAFRIGSDILYGIPAEPYPDLMF